MKKLSLSILFLSFTLLSFAQQEFKSKKNIYLLDVTLSMFGYNDCPDIFNDVRSKLIEAIYSIQNPNTEIVVVTFQDKILNTWSAYANEKGKNEIINQLKDIKKENLRPTRTNIYAAWKRGKELIDPNKLNVIYLLTDGVQNTQKVSKATLYKEVRSWGGFSKNKDYYAFLVELVDAAKDQQLREVIQETNNAQIISGIDFIVFSTKNNSPIISLYDNLDFQLDFIGDRITNIPNDFTITLRMNDANFKLEQNEFFLSKKPFEIQLLPKNDLNSIKSIPKTEWYIPVTIDFDKTKYPNVKLLNNRLSIKIKNKKEMVLKIKVLND